MDQEFYDQFEDDFEAFNRAIRDEANRLGISEEQAGLLVYLRNRSRWTQSKEDKLIEMAHNGIPWPNILAGEDDEIQ